MDGVQVAEDTTMTTPITSFTGAHLGSEPIGSDDAIQTQTQSIQSRLGI